MFSFFRKKSTSQNLSAAPADFSFLNADIHSHLVPGIDDGSPDLDTSLEMISRLKNLGFSKIITTPHTHFEFYDNTNEIIQAGYDRLKQYVEEQHGDIDISVASEYFVDSRFSSEVLPNGLLVFGDNYVLIEVSMAGWPHQFDDLIFSLQSLGYKPVLAHPERYLYERNFSVFENLKNRGVLFQANLLSFQGYYGRGVKYLAEHYLEQNLYSFCGTDAHHPGHVEKLEQMAAEQPEIMIRLADYPNWLNRQL